MTLEIQDPEADALAQELARTTGETIPQAVINALGERLEREKRQHQPHETLVEILLRIGRECAALPLLPPNHDPLELVDPLGHRYSTTEVPKTSPPSPDPLGPLDPLAPSPLPPAPRHSPPTTPICHLPGYLVKFALRNYLFSKTRLRKRSDLSHEWKGSQI